MTYTALPTPDPLIDSEIPDSSVSETLAIFKAASILSNIAKWMSYVKVEYFAGLNIPTEKVPYKHNHKQYKRKGGKPPIDFQAVECWIDLQIAMDARDYKAALPLYFFLRRLIGGWIS